MQGFKNWLEVDELGAFAKRTRRAKTADAFPKEPTNAGVVSKSAFGDKLDTGRQPLDSIDSEKAQKLMIPLGLFIPMYHMSDKVPSDKIRFDFAGEQDKSVLYWIEKIQSGERPALLVASLFGGAKRGMIGLSVKDGNHRATAYYILRVPKIPVILTAGAKNFLGQPR